jgi:hypothetical protein
VTYDPLAAYVRGPRLTELQRRTSPAHTWRVLMRHRANQSVVEVEVEAADTYEAGLRARDQCPGHTIVRIADARLD